jgi:flagellar hook-length control protein FliK
MIIGQVPTTAPQAASGAQAGQSDGAGAGHSFAPLLVSQVGATPNANTANTANAQTVSQLAAAGIISSELAALLSGSTDEGLTAKLDELIGMLQGDGEMQLNPEELLQMEQVLNELNAMMFTMFGVTLLPAGLQNEQLAAGAEGEQNGEGKAGSIDRMAMQEMLTFLKSFLQEGLVKPMGKDQSAQFNLQLDRLKQVLQQGQSQPNASFTMDADQVNMNLQSGSGTTGALLNRLGGQPLHPSVLQVVVTETQSESTMAQATGETTGPTAPTGVIAPAADAVKLTEAAKPAAQQTVHVSRFTELMTGMAVKQFGLTQANGISEARLTLMPEHLGQVDVRISMQNGQLTAQFVTDNAAAREMLENQLAVLRNSLQSQGLQVEKLEVTHNPNPLQSEASQEQRGRGNGGHTSHNQGQRNGGSEEGIAAFESELLEQAAMDELGYGRGINITA